MLDLLDPESRLFDELRHVPGQVAPVGKSALDWIEAALPGSHSRVRCQAMFEEVKVTTRTKYPPQFRQDSMGVGHGAQGERGQGRVAATGVEVKRLGVGPDVLDRQA